MTRGERANKPGLDSRVCLVDGCGSLAPGTHPFCRKHARMVGQDKERLLRFQGTPEMLRDTLSEMGT